MAGVITTGSHPKSLWPGVKAWFGAKYDEHAVELTQIFDVDSSRQNYEELVQQYGFGLVPKKPEGQSAVYDSHSQGYVSRFTHVAYAMGFIITREEKDDNLYESVSMQRAESLALSANQTRENVGANVLNRAFNSSYTGGDGKELLATDHPNAIGGTFSNELDPSADLSEASLEDLAIQVMNAENPRGLRINLVPRRLIIPTALCFEAERILGSQLQNDTANNAINALRTKGVIPEIAINHYLTDTDAFFVKTNAPKGLLWFDRNEKEFSVDGDFDTENIKHKCYMRFATGWGDPLGCFGSAGG